MVNHSAKVDSVGYTLHAGSDLYDLQKLEPTPRLKCYYVPMRHRIDLPEYPLGQTARSQRLASALESNSGSSVSWLCGVPAPGLGYHQSTGLHMMHTVQHCVWAGVSVGLCAAAAAAAASLGSDVPFEVGRIPHGERFSTAASSAGRSLLPFGRAASSQVA